MNNIDKQATRARLENAIAGLETATSGHVQFGDAFWADLIAEWKQVIAECLDRLTASK